MDERLHDYRRARKQFFDRYGARWPDTLADEFDILAPCALSRAEAQSVLATAHGLARIYGRAAQLLRNLSDDALLAMGVPEHLLRIVRCDIPGMADCVVGRFDLAPAGQGYKMLEFNADVPGFMVEAFSVNAAVCRHEGVCDPNDGGEQELASALVSAVDAGVRYTGKRVGEAATVVVTSVGSYGRDRALAEYCSGLLQDRAAQYHPVESLGIDGEGLYDPSGKRIDVLYRFLQLRSIRNELFRPHGPRVPTELGGMLLKLVEERRLAIINPPMSFLLEGKALQAVIWNLAESQQYFSEEERGLIQAYMLPTYLDPPNDGTAFVMKPAYGAEGDTVRVVAASGEVTHTSAYTSLLHQAMVYQRYVEWAPEEMMTEYGQRRLHVVTSCFVLGGKPCGIFRRAGDAITNEMAWVLPVSIRG